MFRKQDFKKVDLLGNGKKNTKIYKVLHISSGKFYALKEVEAKSLDKLNEYKVSPSSYIRQDSNMPFVFRKRQSSYTRHRTTQTSSSSTATSFMRPCTTPSESVLFASSSNTDRTLSMSSGRGSRPTSSGDKKR